MAYRDSGIEWIGKIPEDWSIVQIGSLYFERNEHVSALDFEPLSVTKKGIVPQLDTAAKSDNPNDRKLVKINDFVINSRSDRRGSCGISQYDGSVSLINTVLVPLRSDLISNKFYEYVFHTSIFADEFYRWGHGIVDDLWTTKWQEMKKIGLPFPSYEEQNKISSFLDCKTNRTNALIDNLTNQINKLKEYKKALITNCVTKGLDPNVPLKDSGIEWIGKIPENWSVLKLKQLADPTKRDSFIDGDWIESNYIISDGIRYLTTGNIGDGEYKEQGDGYISEITFTELDCKYAYPGDLVISRLNAPFGRSCILPNTFEKFVLAVDNVILRPRADVSKQYICYVTQCAGYQFSVSERASGSTMQRISRTKLGNIFLPVPPIGEQKTITGYLDKKCSEIDSLISSKQQQIDKLNEYQKSLIYEYVTGKKEVV